MLKLIVFDLDGTLIDSRRDLANAVNMLIAALGGAPLDEATVTSMVGEGAGLLVRRALGAARLDPDTPGALDRFLALYDERLIDNTRPYPGIPEALDRLRVRAPLAVLTNKPARATREILAGLALARYFTDVIGGDERWGRKPDPAGLLHLVEAAGSRPPEAILVGDSRIDLETARRAGTRVCLARYGFGFRDFDADFRDDELRVDLPADIPRVLDPLLSR